MRYTKVRAYDTRDLEVGHSSGAITRIISGERPTHDAPKRASRLYSSLAGSV